MRFCSNTSRSARPADLLFVKAGKGTFDVQLPNGQLFKFTLTIVKGRLQGDMVGERDGVVRGQAKVDAAKAAAATPKK